MLQYELTDISDIYIHMLLVIDDISIKKKDQRKCKKKNVRVEETC